MTSEKLEGEKSTMLSTDNTAFNQYDSEVHLSFMELLNGAPVSCSTLRKRVSKIWHKCWSYCVGRPM